ncbi:MAG: hypothetical protein U0L05_01330 [Schaedlerella sp.]|nr:hypothetical protein [Schaedlerella sp.]
MAIKKDCFAYDTYCRKCLILKYTACEWGKCNFYKKAGSECNSCSEFGKNSSQCTECEKIRRG